MKKEDSNLASHGGLMMYKMIFAIVFLIVITQANAFGVQPLKKVGNIPLFRSLRNRLNDRAGVAPQSDVVATTTPLQDIFHQIKNVDPKKEEQRKYRRTVFEAKDWKKHRSSLRYYKALMSIPRSSVLRGLLSQTMLVTIATTVMVLWNLFALSFKRFPLPVLSMPALPFSLTSPSLGLLLVFRTNTAYSRWKDARIAWSTVSARSWDLMRQGVSWLPGPELKSELVRHTCAFARCLKWHCSDQSKVYRLKEDLSSILTTYELEGYIKARDKPRWALLKVCDTVRRARLLPNVQSHIDKNICHLTTAAATCERIYTTPIPLVYTRQTCRFLFLWLITTPMAMFEVFHPKGMALTVIPINFLNSMFLFGIEELGVQIEEPFSILAITRFTREISDSGKDILESFGFTLFGEEVDPVDRHVTELLLASSSSGTMSGKKVDGKSVIAMMPQVIKKVRDDHSNGEQRPSSKRDGESCRSDGGDETEEQEALKNRKRSAKAAEREAKAKQKEKELAMRDTAEDALDASEASALVTTITNTSVNRQNDDGTGIKGDNQDVYQEGTHKEVKTSTTVDAIVTKARTKAKDSLQEFALARGVLLSENDRGGDFDADAVGDTGKVKNTAKDKDKGTDVTHEVRPVSHDEDCSDTTWVHRSSGGALDRDDEDRDSEWMLDVLKTEL